MTTEEIKKEEAESLLRDRFIKANNAILSSDDLTLVEIMDAGLCLCCAYSLAALLIEDPRHGVELDGFDDVVLQSLADIVENDIYCYYNKEKKRFEVFLNENKNKVVYEECEVFKPQQSSVDAA